MSYLDQSVEQARVRDMLEKKRAMDAADEAAVVARKEYLKAQDALTGAFPAAVYAGPYICGTVFIEANGNHHSSEVRFDYTEAKRIPTSE